MTRVVRRFFDDEIRPAFTDNSPALALTALVGTALLLNKRYLADPGIVTQPEVRWQCVAAWLAATAVLSACLARDSNRWRGGLLGTLCGWLAFVPIMSLRGFSPGQRFQLGWPLAGEPFLMMSLAWLVAAPALALAREPQGRPRWAWGAGLCLVLGALLVLSGRGPAQKLLFDRRYDSYHWGLLTFCWLGLMAGLSGAVSNRQTFLEEGGGLGRWRFWLPLVAGFLTMMVLIIALFAGRQPAFVEFYPLFRPDWRNYDPRPNGWTFFVGYEVTYMLYFVAWEYFFRGWMLFRLEREFGARAIALQCVPFVLMHIGKPPLEFHSSLVAGVVLGWLAWRSRSFWPCALLHCGVAFTMDLTALLSRMHGIH